MKIEFTQNHTLNNISYKKGDTISVSSSIFERLVKDDNPVAKKANVKKSSLDKKDI